MSCHRPASPSAPDSKPSVKRVCPALVPFTVSVADPVLPSLVATTFALPAATAETTPVAFTVATFVFEVLQTTVRPVSTLPLASLRTTDACVVWPALSVPAPNETVTVATGAGGGGGGGGGGGAAVTVSAV